MRNKLLLALCFAPLLSGCDGDGAQAQELGAATVPVLRTTGGQVVGVLMDIAGRDSDEMRVVQLINSDLTVIVISGAGAGTGERAIQVESLFYAAADCSGPPYTTVRGLVTNKLAARRLGRWYVADKDATELEFGYSSQSINDDCLTTSGVGVGSLAVELTEAQSATIDGFAGPYEAWLVPAADLLGI
jgi:hypothetical protein